MITFRIDIRYDGTEFAGWQVQPGERTVQGVIEIRGTVIVPDFYRYELRYGIAHDPDTFSPPLFIQEIAQPETNAMLGLWDTQPLQPGPYTLRIVALDRQGRSVSEDVHIMVNNVQAPPAQPTALPTPTLAPTLTPQGQ